MMEYKRFVSYLYRYEGGQKERNAGFVRLEVRNRQCRIRIFLHHLPVPGEDGEAWVFRQGEERFEMVPLGAFRARDGAVEAGFVTLADNFMDTGLPVTAFSGLAVFLGEQERLYLTAWDDNPVNLLEIRRQGADSDRQETQAQRAEREADEKILRLEEDEETQENRGKPGGDIGKGETDSVSLERKNGKEEADGGLTEADNARRAADSGKAEEEPDLEAAEKDAVLSPEQGNAEEISSQADTDAMPRLSEQVEEEREVPASDVAADEEKSESEQGQPAACDVVMQEIPREAPSGGAEEEKSRILQTAISQVYSTPDESGRRMPEKESQSRQKSQDVLHIPQNAQECGAPASSTVQSENTESGEFPRNSLAASRERDFRAWWRQVLEAGAAVVQKYIPYETRAKRLSSGVSLGIPYETRASASVQEGSKSMGAKQMRVESPSLPGEGALPVPEHTGALPGSVSLAGEKRCAVAEKPSEGNSLVFAAEEKSSLAVEANPAGEQNAPGAFSQDAEPSAADPDSPTWEQLGRLFPHILPMGQAEEREFLRISLQDIGRLPRQYWDLGKNAFVLYGYSGGHHLILMRDGKSGCFLGVPGDDLGEDRLAAEMFGFRTYLKTGKKGYWLTGIKL